MPFEIAELGLPYENLEAAAVDKSPSEVVITDSSGEKFYIVTPDVYEAGAKLKGYKIVVNEGE